MERKIGDLGHLGVFAKVAEMQSFSAAARALGLPKSSVSRNVADLERALGVALLLRSTRKVTLTDAGDVLFGYAVGILATVGEAEAAIDAMHARPAGLIRVNAPLTAGHALIAPLLPAFLSQYPDISVTLDLDNRRVSLEADDVDVAIRVGPLEDSRLVARKIATITSGLYCSPAYLDARGRPATFGDLAAHDVVIDDSTEARSRGDMRTWSASGSGRQATVRVRARLATNSPSAIHASILGGAGIGWLPTFLADADVAAGRLVPVLPEFGRGTVDIHVLFRPQRLIAPKVRALVDFLTARFGALRERGAASG